jgi:hypothetical protein
LAVPLLPKPGDRNIVPTKDDDKSCNPTIVHQELAKSDRGVQNGNKHYGINTTWIGFTYDQYKNEIKDGNFTDYSILDVIVSNLTPSCTFFLHSAFNPETQELLPLAGALDKQQNEGRYFASDHALIGADLLGFAEDVQ